MCPGLALQEISPLPVHQQSSDEELVGLARRTPELFTELYLRYRRRIYSFHLSRTCNPHEAEDLTSQTFVAALENLSHFDEKRSFAGWLFGIAQHKLMDYFRKPNRDSPLEVAENAPTLEASPEDQAAHQVDMAAVARGMAHLPVDQGEALSLRIFGGLSAAEVGKLMGKSEAAVKMLVLRGLRSLQQRLAIYREVA